MIKYPKTIITKEGRALFKKITNTYGLDNEGAKLILTVCCEAFERMRQAQKILVEEGPVFQDRYLQLKPHPCIKVEKDSRVAILQAFKVLGLQTNPTADAENEKHSFLKGYG